MSRVYERITAILTSVVGARWGHAGVAATCLGVVIGVVANPAAAQPPTIAAAANLNFALTEIADRFAKSTAPASRSSSAHRAR